MTQFNPTESSDQTKPTQKLTVLFLCTGNTARSQMAEALLRVHASDRFEITSAGLEPGVLNPYTIRVLEERGINTDGMHAKGSTPMLGRRTFHYLITVCARAEQNCPIFPGVSQRLAWPFEDPAVFVGDEAATLDKFREVRDAIEARILEWVSTLKPHVPLKD
jgi:arsenate reductase (thioredoxin)